MTQTQWHQDINAAHLKSALSKNFGLPTTGDFWMQLLNGDYVQWDMVTGQVTTHRK